MDTEDKLPAILPKYNYYCTYKNEEEDG